MSDEKCNFCVLQAHDAKVIRLLGSHLRICSRCLAKARAQMSKATK